MAALLSSCSPAPAPGRPGPRIAVPEAKAPAAPASTGAPKPASEGPEPVRCERQEVVIEPPALKADLACYPECDANGTELLFRVVNCTAEPLVLTAYGHGDDISYALTLEGDAAPRIEPGTRSAPYRMRARGPEAGTVILAFSPPGTEREKLRVALPVQITDSKADAAAAACQANGDYWGPQGMAGTVQCWKVMPDQNKVCHDARDCEGECLQESEVVVSAKEKRVSGRCSRFKFSFGCHTRIGHTNQGLMPIDRRFSHMCAD